jgi:uncharacterized membrane protein
MDVTYIENNSDILNLRTIWAINYSLVFCLALLFFNSLKVKSKNFGIAALGLSVLAIVVFLTVGLYELSILRTSFRNGSADPYFNHGVMNVALRYISIVIVAILLLKLYKTINDSLQQFKMYLVLFAHTVILWILCAELMNITDLAGIYGQDKLGLSILAGLYAVFMVALGIWKRKSYLRIAAFSLFGVILIKLFLYDLVHLSTISKTIVFIALGAILLVISFMYNKYKHTFTDEK